MEPKKVTDEKGGVGRNYKDLAVGTWKKKEVPSAILILKFQWHGMTRPRSCALSSSCLRNLVIHTYRLTALVAFQFCK